MSEIKVLVCGDVNGHFKLLFSRVNAIVKKSSGFEYLLCVGNFFGPNDEEWKDVKSGKIEVPLTTYILGPNEECLEKYYDSDLLAPNITYVGRSGCILCESGLRIAYLSGMQQPEDVATVKAGASTDHGIYFSQDDVKNLISTMAGTVTDILITSSWPTEVDQYAVTIPQCECETLEECRASACKGTDLEPVSSNLVSLLAKELKPRFHFCGLADIFYERLPYRNHIVLQDKVLHPTRFFSLASACNVRKEKWLYAFKITPACRMGVKELAAVSGPTTKCPYDTIHDLNAERQQNEFFYGRPVISHKQKRIWVMDKPECEITKKKKTIDSSNCWFCLSNRDAEKQLIVSIAEHCYITLAKGILVPEHVLIIPINHAVSSVELSDAALEEIDNYKKSLINYFHNKNQDVVFFERNYFSPHVQIQVVPVPKNSKFKIHETLLELAAQHEYEFAELPCLACVQKVVSKTKPFFYFELIVDKKTEAKYLYIINKKFPLQFGRALLGHPRVLNVPHRVDWRSCGDSEEFEKQMTKKMREEFTPFDFTKRTVKKDKV